MLNENNVYLGDAVELLKQVENDSIDCLITDPPYKIISGGISKEKQKDEPRGIFSRRGTKENVTYAKKGTLFKHNEIKFSEWVSECYRVLKEGTHAYIMTNDRNMQELLNEAEKAGFKLVNILIWKKNNATPNRYYLKNAEFVVMFRKGKARTINNRGTKSVLEINNIRNKQHPVEKPIDLLKILVENSSNEGDLILDPFSGSGSLGEAAIKTKRNYLLFEKDEEFYSSSKERLEKAKKE